MCAAKGCLRYSRCLTEEVKQRQHRGTQVRRTCRLRGNHIYSHYPKTKQCVL